MIPAGLIPAGLDLPGMAAALVRVPGVLGVVLGGSRARGEHVVGSDVDLGLYYRPPLEVAGLQAYARQVAGPGATVTAPGEWGPWVDGGAWLTVQDVAVDWIYRDLDRATASWAAARTGRYRFHAQTGHPLGVPDFAYAGELALCRVLADPTGALTALAGQTREYPRQLRAALVAGLAEVPFLLTIARKAAPRGDATYVAGCLFRAVGVCAHALHGAAGRWLINEKGAVAAAGRLPGAPEHFAARAHGIFSALSATTADLVAAVDAAQALLADTASACAAMD